MYFMCTVINNNENNVLYWLKISVVWLLASPLPAIGRVNIHDHISHRDKARQRKELYQHLFFKKNNASGGIQTHDTMFSRQVSNLLKI